ncbi:hypothetical protein ACLKA6_002329 [Drosophila palustris]
MERYPRDRDSDCELQTTTTASRRGPITYESQQKQPTQKPSRCTRRYGKYAFGRKPVCTTASNPELATRRQLPPTQK